MLLQPFAVAAQEAVFPLGVDEPPLEAGVDITDPFADEPAPLENSVEQPQPEAVISEDLLPPWDLELQSNRQWFESGLQRFVAKGDVTLRLAGGRLQADRLEYSPANRVIWARGAVRFQRGNQYLQASLLRYNLLQGEGEIQDVYGVIDLATSPTDLNLDAPLSGTPQGNAAEQQQRLQLRANPPKPGTLVPPASVAPLPAAEPMACPPEIPPLRSRLPGPWAVTAWGGQMTDATFGETFVFSGTARPETLFGLGVTRRLVDADPFAIELDGNVLYHSATLNRRLRYTGGIPDSQKDRAVTEAQNFWEGTLGIGIRWWIQPWLSFAAIEGVSLNSALSNYEAASWENSAQFLNYLAAEIAISSIFLTAGSRSSNKLAISPESRSKPRVSCVRSFEPVAIDGLAEEQLQLIAQPVQTHLNYGQVRNRTLRNQNRCAKGSDSTSFIWGGYAPRRPLLKVSCCRSLRKPN